MITISFSNFWLTLFQFIGILWIVFVMNATQRTWREYRKLVKESQERLDILHKLYMAYEDKS